jgi:hypothetical protein
MTIVRHDLQLEVESLRLEQLIRPHFGMSQRSATLRFARMND